MRGAGPHDAVFGNGCVAVQFGFSHGVHGPLHLAHGPRGTHIHRTVIKRHSQGQGQAIAGELVPEVFFKQGRSLGLGAGADVIGVHIAIHIHIQAVIAAFAGSHRIAAVTAAGLPLAVFTGLTGQVLHPAQGNAVIGQTAGVRGIVGKASFPAGGKFVGFLKKI